MNVEDEMWLLLFPICINAIMSASACYLTIHLIPRIKSMFVKANLYGIDMNKRTSDKIPEAIGVVTGCIFLITMFLFIPVPFTDHILKNENFPHDKFVEFLAALLSICCMLLLGLADDVLDLRWRHKLLLPTIASLPLLMVYYVNFNSTIIIIPKPLRPWFGFSLDLWIFYYIYMGMLAVFCTNAINILAGINGLEVGQSLIIATSILIFNIIELSGTQWKAHQFSIYFMLPYIATSLALFKFNWYPSQVFVGDTFCYLSGMTFAVVGIIGHFSKTILLFFIPQIINFLYSVLQLFHFIPCPRHRLPKYNKETNKLEPSTTVFNKSELNTIGKLLIWIFKMFKLIKWQEDGKGIITCNNLTLINFILINTGPLKEPTLTTILLIIQVTIYIFLTKMYKCIVLKIIHILNLLLSIKVPCNNQKAYKLLLAALLSMKEDSEYERNLSFRLLAVYWHLLLDILWLPYFMIFKNIRLYIFFLCIKNMYIYIFKNLYKISLLFNSYCK